MRIFVCYRREDSAPWAGRLHDALAERFGAANIFQDVEAVRAGESFVEAMDAAVAEADAMLVVIGPRWAEPGGDGSRRLDAADDYVRRELEAGLSYGTRLVPVLVGGARMPAAGDVPEDLRAIVTQQAVVLRDESWRADVDELAQGLDNRAAARLRRHRGVIAASAVALLVAAAGITYAVTRGDGAGAASRNEPGPEAPTGSLTSCSTPGGDGWDDLAVRSTARSGKGTGFDFSLRSGAAHDVDGGTEVVFAVDATVTSVGSNTLYPDGWAVVPGGDFRQSCFTQLGESGLIGPGTTVTAYVGFRGTGQPDEITAVDIRQPGGDSYRLDLERSD